MQTQTHPRFKKRIPCEFNIGGDHHIGMVLNVSEGGLFVSSRSAPALGSRVSIDLEPGSRAGAIPLQARVVWKKKVHRSLNRAGQGGIGLEIEESSPAYESWVHSIAGATPTPAVAEATEPVPCDFSFQVRLALAGTPRTRSLKVEAGDEDVARARALEICGEGWTILDLKR